MTKKTITIGAYIGLAVFIVAVVVFVSAGKSEEAERSPAKYSAGMLTSHESRFDFGTLVMSDGKVTHQYEVTNGGTEAVTVNKIYTSCMCTEASVVTSQGQRYGSFGMPGHGLASRTNITVAPGETVIVEAVYDPAAHGPSGVGLAQRSIYLETNSAKSPKLELAFQAVVTR